MSIGFGVYKHACLNPILLCMSSMLPIFVQIMTIITTYRYITNQITQYRNIQHLKLLK